jgi:hypothetical protein
MPRTRRGRLLAAAALAVAAGTIAVGAVVGASDTTFERTTTTESRYAKRLEHKRQERENLSPSERHERFRPGERPCPHGSVEKRTRPAQMLGPNTATTITSGELYPVRNGWAAGACFGITWVWAGASGEHPSTGRLVVARYGRWPHARIHVDVDVPGSGPLKIINAPLGPDVVTSAQRGQLPFTSKRGVTGTLDLSTDTVTLSTGEVIEQTKG